MARVMDCWELGNGLAYIEGPSAAARVIAKAGHEVQFAARDLTHAERLLGGKFTFYQAPTAVIRSGMVLKHPMTFADVLIDLGWGNPSVAAALILVFVLLALPLILALCVIGGLLRLAFLNRRSRRLCRLVSLLLFLTTLLASFPQ